MRYDCFMPAERNWAAWTELEKHFLFHCPRTLTSCYFYSLLFLLSFPLSPIYPSHVTFLCFLFALLLIHPTVIKCFLLQLFRKPWCFLPPWKQESEEKVNLTSNISIPAVCGSLNAPKHTNDLIIATSLMRCPFTLHYSVLTNGI